MDEEATPSGQREVSPAAQSPAPEAALSPSTLEGDEVMIPISSTGSGGDDEGGEKDSGTDESSDHIA